MMKKEIIDSNIDLLTQFIEKYVLKHLISLRLKMLHFSSSFLNNFYKTNSQNHPSKMYINEDF